MENKSKESQLQSNDKEIIDIPFKSFPYVEDILALDSNALNIPSEYTKDDCKYRISSLSYYDKDKKCIIIPIYIAIGNHRGLFRVGIPKDVIMECINDDVDV